MVGSGTQLSLGLCCLQEELPLVPTTECPRGSGPHQAAATPGLPSGPLDFVRRLLGTVFLLPQPRSVPATLTCPRHHATRVPTNPQATAHPCAVDVPATAGHDSYLNQPGGNSTAQMSQQGSTHVCGRFIRRQSP